MLLFVHGWEWKVWNRIHQSPIFRNILKRGFDSARVVLVLSSAAKECLVGIGVDPEKIVLMTTMFDGTLIVRSERTRSSAELNCIYLGRLVREKGLYELLESLEFLRLGNVSVKFILAGTGPEEEAIKSWLTRNALENLVGLPGYLTGAPKADALDRADVFVLPSYSEGCPVALLEAMGAGLPVIVSRVGSVPDLIEQNVNGIILDEVTPDAIGKAIERLARHPELRLTMSRNNAELAWQRFEARIVSKRIEELYQQLATDNRH